MEIKALKEMDSAELRANSARLAKSILKRIAVGVVVSVVVTVVANAIVAQIEDHFAPHEEI